MQCAAAEIENDGGNQWKLVETEFEVHIVCQRHLVGLLISARLVAEVEDGSVMDIYWGVNHL